tara:strand:+ start:3570 stop:3755 length:186 start_codon:yes stop_codon:yes gene_type:complete
MMDTKGLSDILAAAANWAREVIPAVGGRANLSEADNRFIDVLKDEGVLTPDELAALEPSDD